MILTLSKAGLEDLAALIGPRTQQTKHFQEGPILEFCSFKYGGHINLDLTHSQVKIFKPTKASDKISDRSI